MDYCCCFCVSCLVFLVLSCLFLAVLWSSAGKRAYLFTLLRVAFYCVFFLYYFPIVMRLDPHQN